MIFGQCLLKSKKEMYDELKEKLIIEIKNGKNKKIDDASPILKRILRLEQITSNPKILNEDIDFISGKEIELNSLVKEIINREEKVIIWTNLYIQCRLFLQEI